MSRAEHGCISVGIGPAAQRLRRIRRRRHWHRADPAPRTDSDADSDADADSDTNPHTNAYADPHTDPNTDADANANANAHPHAHPNANPDPHQQPDRSAHADRDVQWRRLWL